MTSIDRRVIFDSGYEAWISSQSSDSFTFCIRGGKEDYVLFLSLEDMRALADVFKETVSMAVRRL